MTNFDYSFGVDSPYSKMSIESDGERAILHATYNEDLGEVITLRGRRMA